MTVHHFGFPGSGVRRSPIDIVGSTSSFRNPFLLEQRPVLFVTRSFLQLERRDQLQVVG